MKIKSKFIKLTRLRVAIFRIRAHRQHDTVNPPSQLELDERARRIVELEKKSYTDLANIFTSQFEKIPSSLDHKEGTTNS
jgi:hypothetical protein